MTPEQTQGRAIEANRAERQREAVCTFTVGRNAHDTEISFTFAPTDAGFALPYGEYALYTAAPAQQQQGEAVPFAWHVCSVNKDESLSLEFAAAWEEAAHEHINDAIAEDEIEEAASWVVRPAYHHPAPAQQQGEAVPFGYLLIDSAFHTEDFTRLRPEKENPTEQVIALYAHPAPAQQPLTQPEKQRLWNDAMYNNRSSTTDAAMEYGSEIERAHGTGGEK